MGEKVTRRTALACLGSGAIVTALGSTAFDRVEAGRSVTVDVSGSDQAAFLEIENLGNTVDKKNRATNILQITNNFDQTLSLNVDVDLGSGIETESTFDSSVSESGGTTTFSASCDGNSGAGQTDATVTVNSAEGSTVAVRDGSYTFDIDRDCPGNGSGGGTGGAGFSSASVSDLSANVGDGETETQQFSFSPSDKLKANNGDYVDVLADDAESGGVTYASSDSGYSVTAGSGTVSYDPGSGALFRYEVGKTDNKNETITVEATVKETPESGTFDVEFKRSDRNDRLTTQFSIQ